jgi:hypothetical protein
MVVGAVAQNRSANTKIPLSDDDIVAQTGIIVAAGQDTTVSDPWLAIQYDGLMYSGEHVGVCAPRTCESSSAPRQTAGGDPLGAQGRPHWWKSIREYAIFECVY